MINKDDDDGDNDGGGDGSKGGKFAFFLYRGSQEALYDDEFIANDDSVRDHMKILYDHMGSQVLTNPENFNAFHIVFCLMRMYLIGQPSLSKWSIRCPLVW